MARKVVQLTDTHLFASPDGTQKGVNTLSTLKAVVDDVAARHPDLDLLLLTGDLSQDETAESYELLKRTLAPLHDAPFHAIPGNHDNLARMEERLAGRGFHVCEDARLSSWRIAMLNSQVSGRVHGEVGAEQLTRLRESLEAGGEHTLVMLHHPPVPVSSAWLDASRCRDGTELLAALAGLPVKAVVCGHVHQPFETVVDGIPVLTTPSTCVQFTPGAEEFAIDDKADPGYRIFELHDDGAWATTVHRVPVD